MLKELRIKNFAVVEDVKLGFREGLNVLTGSTGAGKSLILSAVNMLQGVRTNAKVIRRGESSASVEAVFAIEHPLAGMEARPAGETVTLRRDINADGRTAAYIDGKQSTLKALAEMTAQLIEPHGQNEQMRLKSPENHGLYLDIYAGVERERERYTGLLERLREAENRLEQFNRRISLAKEKRELLEHRLEELERAGIEEGEKQSLEETVALLENSQKIMESIGAASQLVYEQESSAVELVARSRKLVAALGALDKAFPDYTARLEEARIILEDVGRELSSYLDSFEFDPESFAAMQDRLAFMQSLERRYGKDIDAILRDRDEWRRQLDEIGDEAGGRAELEGEIGRIAGELAKAASALSDKRTRAARTFDEKVGKLLASMAMPGVEFKTRLERERDSGSPVVVDKQPVRLFADGIDRVEFFIRTNRGERMGSVSEIASSGETSRIALALKDVLARGKQGSVLIFDELDSGVGADMGDAISEKLERLSEQYQIISITHMPQIAARAGSHMVVRKRTVKGRTFVDVVPVSGDERTEEIARMLGGSRGSDRRIALAQEMLDGSRTRQSTHDVRP